MLTQYEVIMPYSSFIKSWSTGDGGSLDWLLKSVGKVEVDWEANTYSEDCAIFYFKREEDAIAFKLRWL